MSFSFGLGWIVIFVLMALIMWFCVSSFHGGRRGWCPGWDHRHSIFETYDEEEGNTLIAKSGSE